MSHLKKKKKVAETKCKNSWLFCFPSLPYGVSYMLCVNYSTFNTASSSLSKSSHTLLWSCPLSSKQSSGPWLHLKLLALKLICLSRPTFQLTVLWVKQSNQSGLRLESSGCGNVQMWTCYHDFSTIEGNQPWNEANTERQNRKQEERNSSLLIKWTLKTNLPLDF